MIGRPDGSALMLLLLMAWSLSTASVGAQSAPPWTPPAEVQTLRQLLAAESIDGSGLTPAALDRRITSYAVENSPRYFATGYYLQTGGNVIPDVLHVSVLDKKLHAWADGAIKERPSRREFGSVIDIRHVGSLMYIEMHINPSASHTLVLTPRLERVTSLPGWIVGTLPDGSVLYHHNQIHFAPTHSYELSLFDVRTRRSQKVYPLRPYQPLRRAYIERVRGVYDAETRRDPEWARTQNHHGDPERFDSSFREPLVIAPGTRKFASLPATAGSSPVMPHRDTGASRFAFIVRFGSAPARPPTPEDDIIVTCDLARPSVADRCHETRKADYQQQHPTFTDEALLKAILR